MSYIARRGLSTLIPPKVASPNAIGAAQDAARMERVVNFYAGLPRGPAAPVKASGLIGRYQARYFSGKNASGAPLVHAIAGILILGYSMEYYFHLQSSIVMAEQSSRDVVDHLSGGEPSPSDVPASTTDNSSAGGDAGKTEHIAMKTTSKDETPNGHETAKTFDSPEEGAGSDKDTGSRTTTGAGLVATRVLELNGLASASDGGDDTASQGGSESDASRTDSRNHTRNGSVKKPSSFKPVSFAKQKFSVPKVPGAPAPSKAPEKTPSTSTTPLGTPQPTSRPRLVAKTTLGMRDSLSKNGAGGANSGGSGPDGSQVWNKNRPVAPPPPKHLTDEELKQQYGIHMTSRIQEDGAISSESKWADIDDDEDDWAPETIEWTDGTKVNLTHTHADPLPGPTQPVPSLPEPKEAPQEAPKEAPVAPKVPAAPKPITSIGPNPTILKLGANAERQARTAGSSSKGASDKVPSSSTSPAPPSKSPWAPLPPVERVSPVNGPMAPPPHPRMPLRHLPQRDDGPHAPPKEIAADDFNRTWKEAQSGAPRELFNSRSGQYEPVTDTRRPSWRHDQHPHPRAPAVLQRSNDHPSGPAEPSAAFQTHRSSHQDGMGWGGRRRTSSNVSGGSGGFGRRMSFGRPDAPPRLNDGRRGSQTIIDPALMGPEQHHHHPHYHGKEEVPLPGPNGLVPRPAENVPVEAPPEPQPVAPPQEDPVVLQERIMKEKRLEARQRRIEQEEKEEAAKKERIRQRLEAMGPAPEKKAPETRTPAPPSQPQPQPQPHHPPHTSPRQTTHPISPPPKPPVPEPTGAPKQYGMMKVHHPDSVKKLVGAHDRPSDNKHFTRRVSSPHQEAPREPLAPHSPVKSSGQPEERWQQGNLKVSTSPWSHPSITATSPTVKNPWKPLGSDRTPTLGNGIFDQPLGFSSRENSLRQLGFDQSAMSNAPNFVAAPAEQAACLPSPEARHPSFDPLHPIGRPSPIGPPTLHQSRGVEAWRSFAQNVGDKERQDQQNFMEHFHKTHQKGEHITAPSTFDQTWKQIKPTEDGRRVVTAVVHKTVGKDEPTAEPVVQPLSNPLATAAPPVDGLPSSDLSRSGPIPVRSSRFFPSATEQQPKRQVVEREQRSSSPSPPPPEEVSSHPVYFGDSSRPHVHLPIPKPVVKLPPKVVSAPAPPPTFASMAAAPPRNAAPQPPAVISWQDKINSLFKTGGPKTGGTKNVLAVTPATKEALPVHTAAVSVSFPRAKFGLPKGDGDIAVEQVERQDEMFEDREPGSLPAVRVPPMAPANSWSQLPLRQLRKASKQVHPQTMQPFNVGLNDRDTHGNVRATIHLPGADEPKVFLIPRKAGPLRPRNNNNSNPRPRKGNSKPASNTGSRQQSNKTAGWGHTAH
ncbi:ATPase [Penicillium brevicompactum]